MKPINDFYKNQHKKLNLEQNTITNIFTNHFSYSEGTEMLCERFINNIVLNSEDFFNDLLNEYYKNAFEWCKAVKNKYSSIELSSENYSIIIMKKYNEPLEAHIYYEGPFTFAYKPIPLEENPSYIYYCAVIDFTNKKISKQEYLKKRFSSVSSTLRRNLLYAKKGEITTLEKAQKGKEALERKYNTYLEDYNSKQQMFLNSKPEYDNIVKSLVEVLKVNVKTIVNFE